ELIPADELAIQWDLAAEQGAVESALTQAAAAAKEVAQRMLQPARDVCSAIPKNVHLGYHMCFGTLNGWPGRSPKDMTGAVLLSNAAVECSDRPVDFLHIPTLGSATDEFFRPMSELKPDGARVYMGAIHHLYGPEGMRPQLKTIQRYVPEFGLAAPCGF